MRTARLFVTHTWCQEIEAEFLKLAACADADTWLLVDSEVENIAEIRSRYPLCHVFEKTALLSNGLYERIPTRGLIGHGHLPILDLFMAHSTYDYYWFVEYDVRYTGDWASFFGRFDALTHDLITSHIRRYSDEPLWPWWTTFGHPSLKWPVQRWIRSFNVIYRISRSALVFLDAILRTGWHGHHEVLVPTLMDREGFRLLDFGGDGCFADPDAIDSVYTSASSQSGYLNPEGTLCFRPARASAGDRPETLYHPVKPPAQLETAEEREAALQLWQQELTLDLRLVTRRQARREPVTVTRS